ncbi:hypothetical protein [Sphingomonas astaxanthinifaciens]|uniref:Inner membrane protein n=1 Tax=Sphingomonas astaxanthinifaciens DSM 22298 TaxID=1123267 RepID=A0ABQ5Z7F5_9SPHN|nr:hypothetical protein [Sphingomonas astaxanthinifaciens]GLR46719.1 hypothetical protein GCM10007925_04300 [Sphingomonas astaxanthinifaciens DSM 22298]
MSNAPARGMSLSAILLTALLLLLVGAGAAVWALGRYPQAAQFVGVAKPADAVPVTAPRAITPPAAAPGASVVSALPATEARVATLEERLARVENATARAEGSAGRADALLVAFAARRAIDRGVALGYLEPLLSERFGATNPKAVATIVTASRRPVRLDQLTADFAVLAPRLKAAPESASLWQNLRREMGNLVSIRRADQPSQRPVATYERASARLTAGQVDQALAEAMRLPGIGAAPRWVADARSYIAAHRALDEIESAALLSR